MYFFGSLAQVGKDPSVPDNRAGCCSKPGPHPAFISDFGPFSSDIVSDANSLCRARKDGIRDRINVNVRHLSSTSGLALAIALFTALPNMASAQCLLNGTTSTNTGTTGNDTMLCDPTNDPAGGNISTDRGSDTITVEGGVTTGHINARGGRNDRASDVITVTDSTVNGSITATAGGGNRVTVEGSTVTGIAIVNGSLVIRDSDVASIRAKSVNITNSTVAGTIEGRFGSSGRENIRLTNSTVTGNVVTYSGTDNITLDGSTVEGSVFMAGPAPSFSARQGSNFTMLGNSRIEGDLNGSNGGGNGGIRDHPDRVTLAGGTIVGNVRMFRARDQLTLSGTSVLGDIDMGVHNDSFTWTDGAIGGQVLMGADNDTVTVSLTTRDVDTILDGGTGFDSFRVIDATTNVQPATIRGFERAQSIRSVVTFDTLMLNGVDTPGDNNLATDLEVTRGDVTLGGASLLTNLLGSRDAEILRVTDDTVVSGSIEGAGNRDTIEILGNASVTVGVFGGGAGHNGGADAADTITINTTGSVGTVDGGEGLDAINLLSGTVGTALGGTGDDTITLDGATISGIIDGGADNDAFIWSSGTMAGFQGGDGSDTATVTAAEYDGTQVLDGGDDLGVADGFIDVLTFGNFSGALNGATLLNWEAVGFVAGITQQIDDLVTLQVLASCGGSTILGGASMSDDVDGCIDDDTMEISGTSVIAVDVDGAGGSDTITVSGDASVTGAVRGDGEGQDASGAFDDADTITISTTGTVGSVHGGVGGDTVVLSGGTIGSATGDDGADQITLDGATVSATIDGGADADTIALNSGTVADVIGGTGNDTVTLDGATVLGTIDTGDNVDTVSLLSGSVSRVDTGGSADTITLDGAVVAGTVFAGAGDDRMTWSSGNMAGFNGGDGSDLLTVTASEYDLSQILDGGDDASVADGFIDELTLDGVNGDLTGGNLINWEFIHLVNVVSVIDDLITPNLTTCGGSLVLGGASMVDDVDGCIQADAIEITGTTVIANDIDGAGGSDTITISGDASVTGAVRGDGPGQDDSAAQDAADIITINTTGSVGSVHGGQSDDRIDLLAGTVGAAFGGSGEDIMTLDGATVTGNFDAGDDADTVNLLSGLADGVTSGSGNDTILLDGATITTDVRGAAGEDLITITSGLVEQDVYLGTLANTTTDEDTLVMTGGTISRNIRGDRGDDRIALRGGDLGQDVLANWGDDTVILNGTTVGGNIDTGRDDDTIVLLSGSVTDVFGGNDEDAVTLNGATVAGVLSAGDGMDLVTVLSGSVGGDIRLGRDVSTDEDTLLMTGGTVAGGVLGDRGNDTITLGGGSVALDVNGGWGDDVVTLEGAGVAGEILGALGDDTFVWSSGTMAGFNGGDGSDIATVTAAEYDGSQILDGGDDLGVADGFIDVLTFGEFRETLNGANLLNWEAVGFVAGITQEIEDLVTLQVQASCGGSTTLSGASMSDDVDGCIDDDTMEISGATVIANDIDGAGGADTITVSGEASVTGAVRGDGDGQDASATADAGDTITISTTGTVGSVHGGLGGDTIGLLSGAIGTASGDSGSDTITLDGAAVASVVSGGNGNDAFAWASGTTTGFDGGDGSDTATVTATEYDGTQVLDGGDDTDVADGFIDALMLQGVSVTVNSGSVVNWEAVTVLDGTIDFGPDMTVGSGPGLGLIAGSDGIISSSGDFALTGDLVTLTGGTYQNRSGAAALIDIVGNIRNAGRINIQDGVTGDKIAVSGDYSGGGALQLDVDFSGDTADTLVIAGDVVSGGTTIFVADISSGEASGNDILLIDVQGATNAGDFQLANGEVDVNGMVYGLHLVGSQWFLQLELLPSNVVYEVYPQTLHALNKLQGHHRRVQGRAWLAGGDPLCHEEREEMPSQANPLCQDAGLWMKFTGAVSDLDPEFSTTEVDFGTSDIDYDMHSTRFELGFDTLLGEYNRGKLAGGIWAFYGSASLSGSSPVANGNVDTDATGVGASLTWYENSGFYADAQLQYTEFKSDLSSDGTQQVSDNKGSGYAASLEIGKTFALNPSFSLTPELQYMYYDVDFDSFTGVGGEPVYLEDGSTSELRLGGTLEYRPDATGAKNNRVYATANVFHKFDATTVVNSAGSPLFNKARPWRGEIGFGGSHEWIGASGARSAIYGEVTASSEFGSGWNSGSTLSGSVGFKIEF
ncbi:autotransporter outer membrane beta-barrel domain-containing protein [Ruegeria sp. HKCCD8929]|uniref:autotransporter outer membrane beta-barrel domain-containing protein n=1 Tax=Ruegeria sp. HKCCD8929 TaxID=2683006 RepID=UPI001487E9E6|nr:autotransporter outer membrane beta-barrel domain-containing protein [Ruegeria sp. HKCCD8929]